MKIIKGPGSKNLHLWLITIFLVLLSIEVGLRLINYFTKPSSPYSNHLSFDNKDWGKELTKETDEVDTYKFAPFFQWEISEHHGKYLNVNSEGLRKTWNPENIPGQVPNTIYVFGGSTMLGSARDDFTIPSYLSKKLNKDSNNYYMVYNYGGNAYTFPQEIIRLIILLNKGHRPRYVIFYDGANDVYSAYQSGATGSIQNIEVIRHKLESNPPCLFWEWITQQLQKNSMLISGLSALKRELFKLYRPKASSFSEIAASNDDNRLKTLSNNIAESYLTWKDMLDHLSKAYKFDYYCFWQPVIFTEDKIFPEDGMGNPRIKDKSLAKLYKYTNFYLKEKSIPHFWNISNVLGERIGPCYLDWCHITEEGNDIVAEKIGKIFKEIH